MKQWMSAAQNQSVDHTTPVRKEKMCSGDCRKRTGQILLILLLVSTVQDVYPKHCTFGHCTFHTDKFQIEPSATPVSARVTIIRGSIVQTVPLRSIGGGWCIIVFFDSRGGWGGSQEPGRERCCLHLTRDNTRVGSVL